jgi:hypothetical protein
MAKHENQETAALEQRVADIEDRLTAVVGRVADLEELHAAELGALRARQTATDPEAQRQRAEAAETARARILALKVLGRAETDVRHTLTPIRNGLRYGGMIPSTGTPLRKGIPELVKAVDDLRGLLGRDPWPEGKRRFEQAEGLLRDGTDLLTEFDQRLAEREAARQPAARTEGHTP